MTQPGMDMLTSEFDGAESLKERVSTWLDVAGGLAIAGGVAGGLFPLLGLYAVAVGGVIVIVLNLLAGMLRSRVPALETIAPVIPLKPPGPEHEGNLHVSGR